MTHHRTVLLNRARRTLEIEDWLDTGAAHQVALAFHLGPAVEAELDAFSLTMRLAGPLGAHAAPRQPVLARASR